MKVLMFLICSLLLADHGWSGRFDANILNTTTDEELTKHLRISTLDHPIQNSVATIYKGYDKFAGVYIGNRIMLTAAHCVDGISSKGYRVDFRNCRQVGSQIIEETISNVKVLKWKFYKNYDLGENDFAVVVLDRDPLNVSPAKIWKNNRNLPNSEGIVISPVANIDLEKFNGFRSNVLGLKLKERVKHSFYTQLLKANHLPKKMKNMMVGNLGCMLSSYMHDNEKYNNISKKVYGKTRTGDSGSPIFIKSNGIYYLVGLVSGGYYEAEGVFARNLADLYVNVGFWYRKSKNSIFNLIKNLLLSEIKLEKRKLSKRKKRYKKVKSKHRKFRKKYVRSYRKNKKKSKLVRRYLKIIKKLKKYFSKKRNLKKINNKKRKRKLNYFRKKYRRARKISKKLYRIMLKYKKIWIRKIKNKKSNYKSIVSFNKKLKSIKSGIKKLK